MLNWMLIALAFNGQGLAMGWIKARHAGTKDNLITKSTIKMKKADKSSFAGTKVDSDTTAQEFRLPAYCQTQC